MERFALIGAAGYIAPRHMKAIKETGNVLVAALDKCDSVGVLDSYFPDANFFTEFERFDRYVDKLRRKGQRIDYISICSPNYLHDAHIRFALRNDANAICEKPLVLNPWNLNALEEIERETGKKVYNILQLRVHPTIVSLKRRIEEEYRKKEQKYKIDLTYITSRGKWYFVSWKGDIQKSGGVATNIGIHFFDMLMWIFGELKHYEVHYSEPLKKMAGYVELEKAEVRWFLSVDSRDLPEVAVDEGKRTYRSITIDSNEVEFSGGFTDLHTVVYQEILDGKGFDMEDARPSIELVYRLRNIKPVGFNDRVHPLAEVS
jgi:UDP-N-acetyl-2-amino-2-deoxyglucuronate dehydrogenase